MRDVTGDTVTWRAKRPALLISSTSWTGENRRIKLVPFPLGQSLRVSDTAHFNIVLNISLLKNILSCHVTLPFNLYSQLSLLRG